MADYMSALWFKARTDIRSIAEDGELTMAAIGLFYVLMAEAKRDLTDGSLSSRRIHKLCSGLGFRNRIQALGQLEKAGLLTVTEDGIQLDWRGQETAASVARKSATRPDGKTDIKRLHEQGDHEKCRKRGLPDDCPHATQWAKGHPRKGDENQDHPRGRSESESDQTQSIKSDVDGMTKRGDGTSSRPGSRPGRSRSVVVPGKEYEL